MKTYGINATHPNITPALLSWIDEIKPQVGWLKTIANKITGSKIEATVVLIKTGYSHIPEQNTAIKLSRKIKARCDAIGVKAEEFYFTGQDESEIARVATDNGAELLLVNIDGYESFVLDQFGFDKDVVEKLIIDNADCLVMVSDSSLPIFDNPSQIPDWLK